MLVFDVADGEPEREEHRVAEDVGERQGRLAALAQGSDAFRRVVVTGPHMQLAVMTIPPGGEVGEEVHDGTDQFLIFVEGQAEAELDGVRSAVPEGSYVFVPAGTRHNFVNTGSGPLRIATTYAPPEHPPGTLHPTKEVADADEAHHH
jgi:mannose-6-phosphate isomerase-like protein (cupin superfamily)